jgi:hypothetical protein
MITVKPTNFLKYKTKNTDRNVLLYPGVFEGPIIQKIGELLQSENKVDLAVKSLAVGLYQLTGKIYRQFQDTNSVACITFGENTIQAGNKTVKCPAGSVIILGSQFRKAKYKLPELCLRLYEIQDDTKLDFIYLDIGRRLDYATNVKEKLSFIKKLDSSKQAPEKYLKMDKIGKGCYANIFKSSIDFQQFAVKISHGEAIRGTELTILRQIIRPILERKMCPNLPLIYETFECDGQENCVSIVSELGSETLKEYLKKSRRVEEIFSALFQIMVALHAIQLYGQIMHYDIKKENILVYNVKPGGFWHYRVRDKDFYVPNFGQLFVLNDFGLSRPMSPDHIVYKEKDYRFRLGSRYAIVKDGIFVPFNSLEKDSLDIEWGNGMKSKGWEFEMGRTDGQIAPCKLDLSDDIKKFLKSKNISDKPSSKSFFRNSEVIPPFEFYNDTQDVIRMFIGGKRCTQKGSHQVYKTIPKKVIKQLSPYLGKTECAKNNFFPVDPSQVQAGAFIEKFFGFYREKQENILGSYTVAI